MKAVALLKFIHFGGQLSFLRSCPKGVTTHVKEGMIDKINRVIQFVKESEFKVTFI